MRFLLLYILLATKSDKFVSCLTFVDGIFVNTALPDCYDALRTTSLATREWRQFKWA